MSVEVKSGNIFTSSCQTLVNTVNCVGVMGAGIALECRLRYPAMFEKYKILCGQRRLSPGVLWLYKGGAEASDINDKWILNFPTKVEWKYPSKIEWVVSGLDKFVETYREKAITSIAFPVLGGLNGGLDPDEVVSVMQTKLKPCDIPIEIYHYRADASDDVYERFKSVFKLLPEEFVASLTKMRRDYVRRVALALDNPDVCQLNQLARIDGIGAKTMEKLFGLVRTNPVVQGELPL